MSHHTHDRVSAVRGTSDKLTLHQLWREAAKQLGSENVTLEFSRDVIQKLVCPKCQGEEELFAAVGSVSYEQGKCPKCGEIRVVVTTHQYSGSGEMGDRTLRSVGLPPFDVFVARTADGDRELALLMEDDAESVLGHPMSKAAVL
jgi:phage FluMu protein Com